MDPPEEKKIPEAKVQDEISVENARKCSQCSASPSYNSALSEEYTCEICTDYLLPPVYQCVNGHLLCEACHSKMKRCPQCRQNFLGKKIRNLVVERIVRETIYNCKNLREGCQMKLKYDQLRDHHLNCEFLPLNFCESLGISCDFKTLKSEIGNHLKNIHGIQGVEDSQSKSELVVDIDQTITKVELTRWSKVGQFLGLPYFFRFDDNIFFLKTLVDAKEKCISWMVCAADGNSKSVQKYLAKVRYFPAETSDWTNSLVWKGRICSFDKKIEDVPTLSIPLKSLVFQPFESRSTKPTEYSARTRIAISIQDSPILISNEPPTGSTSVLCLKTALTYNNHKRKSTRPDARVSNTELREIADMGITSDWFNEPRGNSNCLNSGTIGVSDNPPMPSLSKQKRKRRRFSRERNSSDSSDTICTDSSISSSDSESN